MHPLQTLHYRRQRQLCYNGIMTVAIYQNPTRRVTTTCSNSDEVSLMVSSYTTFSTFSDAADGDYASFGLVLFPMLSRMLPDTRSVIR